MPCHSAACHSGCMFPQDCMRNIKPKDFVAFVDQKDGNHVTVRVPGGEYGMSWDQAQKLRNDLNACLEWKAEQATKEASEKGDTSNG